MSIGARCVANIYRILVKAVEGKYNDYIRNRVLTFLKEWRRRFAIVYGREPREISFLSVEIEYPDLFLYALHTYYVILVKSIASCIVGVHLGYDMALELIRKGLDALREIEIEGKPFKQYGILNLVEPDIYSWYLVDKERSSKEFEYEMTNIIKTIGKKLEEYNFSFIMPTRDILKRLYQNIIPRDLRRALGEFYTPDWLAEYILDRVGFTGKIEHVELEEAIRNKDFSNIRSIRLLDPACGSGTFIFHAILRVLKSNPEITHRDPNVLAKAITENIVGFDISPLAIITAKITYLLALSQILKYLGEIRIPIYETDSILVPEGQYIFSEHGNYKIPIPLPEEIRKLLERKGVFPGIVIPSKAVENLIAFEKFIECLRELYYYVSDKEYFNNLLKKYSMEYPEKILRNNIQVLLILSNEGRDKIWLDMVKNWITPIIIMKKPFRYIVGNPPWINISNMPKEYVDILDIIFRNYDLVPKGGSSTMLEFAMLFIYVSANRFLEHNGILGMLITKRVFEGGHGSLFRRFTIPIDDEKVEPLKLIECHDLERVKPFHQDVQNEPGIIILKKGEQTKYFKYIIWQGSRLSTTDTWEPTIGYVLKHTKRIEKTMLIKTIKRQMGRIYVEEYVFVSPEEYVDIVLRPGNPYDDVHNGAQLAPREIILLEPSEVERVSSNICRIRRKYIVEDDYVYPVVRGSTIAKWVIKGYKYAVIPYDRNGRFLGDRLLQTRLWQNYYRLDEILGIRVRRRIGWENQNRRLREIITYAEDLVRKGEEHIADKVYRKFGRDIVLLYKLPRMTRAFKPIKVVWIDIAEEFNAVVVTEKDGKPVIPDVTTGYVNIEDLDEAHYVCAILNSRLINKATLQITPKHHHPRVFRSIYIPKYNPENPIHLLLSLCSYIAHEIAYKIFHQGIRLISRHLVEIEKIINVLVEALYEIGSPNINEIANRILDIVNEINANKKISLDKNVINKVYILVNKATKQNSRFIGENINLKKTVRTLEYYLKQMSKKN